MPTCLRTNISESKAEQIDRVKANLPLPDDPVGGAAPDSNTMDGRTVNVGSGGVNVKLGTDSSDGMGGGPATQESDVRQEGGGFKSGVPPRNENTDMPMVDKDMQREMADKKDPNDVSEQ